MEFIKNSIFDGDYVFISLMARSLACMFAGFVLIRLYNEAMNTPYGLFNYSTVLRTAVVIFLICGFNTFVLKPIDMVTGLVSKGLVASVSKDQASLDAKVINLYEKVENSFTHTNLGEYEDFLNDLETPSEEDISFNTSSVLESEAEGLIEDHQETTVWSKIWNTIKASISMYCKFNVNAASSIVSWFISIIVKLVRYILICVSGVYCIILGILGPLIFACSIIPNFESGAGQWIARYIQISLWVPVTSVVDFVNFKIKDVMMDMFMKSDLAAQMIFPTFHIIILDLVAMIMLLAIPSICGWIIQSSGASEVNSSVANGASRAIRAIATKH